MSDFQELSGTRIHLIGVEQLHKRWGWFVALGVLMVILGTLAIGSSAIFTLATMEFVGWLMVIGGLFQIGHAFSFRDWGGFFIDLLSGILYTVAGFMIVAHPA